MHPAHEPSSQVGTEAQRILIVEDDFRLAALVREFLEGHGFEVLVEGRGDRAAERIMAERPDLVILDLMLPGLDGLSVCRKVRPTFDGPVLMLTARGDEVDEVVGLEVGADDYMAKPVRPRLLLARIHSLLRRAQRADEADGDTPRDAPAKPQAAELALGAMRIDLRAREVRQSGALIDLTTAEFELLAYLAQRAGTIVSREAIYRDLRGIAYDGLDRSIDLRVARLRKKLGDDGKHPARIKSIRGQGYLFVGQP